MKASALLLVGLLGGTPELSSKAQDLAAYKAARAQVGRGAEGHIRLALWCEGHGLAAERNRHLALAVLAEPGNATARGLMGLVAYRGKWQRPDAVAETARADAARAAALAQYREKRARAGGTAEGQWALALWCEQNGLKDESVAHLRAAVALDPSREAAWKRLGYRKTGGRWRTDAQLAAEKRDVEAQNQADRRWRPTLERQREALEGKDANRRESAVTALGAVSDPRSVPSVWAVFAVKPDARRQTVAVQLFGQIDAAAASRCLAILSVSGASAEVRRAATETLTRRDVREFANLLIALVREPIRYQVKPPGAAGPSGTLSIHGRQADLTRVYTPPLPAAAATPLLPTDQVAFDADGLPVLVRPFVERSVSVLPERIVDRTANDLDGLPSTLNAPGLPRSPGSRYFMHRGSVDRTERTGFVAIPVGRIALESARARAAARQTLENDVDRIEEVNRQIQQANDRVLPILALVAGRDLGPDRDAWTKWWVDQIGMTVLPQRSQEKTTVFEEVPIDFQPQEISPSTVVTSQRTYRLASCFAAGTAVQTQTGLRTIETIEPGDLVLTQSTTTGALGYHPVLKVHRNPPSATFRVTVGGETVVSSAFHRFWAVGRGWVMARDLKPGDTLRTLDGPARVAAVDDDRVQPVFNLDVADDADFFVGRSGTLVHDNSLPDTRLAPFDAPPALAAK